MPESASDTVVELLLEALGRDQRPLLKITSDSMAPLLRQGDQVQLGPVSLESVKVGDVVVIGPQADLLAHRFWGILGSDENSRLVTRGDRLAYFDPLQPASQLKAVIVARQRNDSLLDLRQGPGGWLNRRLVQLAKLEAQAIGLAWPTPEPAMENQVRPSLAGRLLRRLLVLTSKLLVRLVDVLA